MKASLVINGVTVTLDGLDDEVLKSVHQLTRSSAGIRNARAREKNRKEAVFPKTCGTCKKIFTATNPKQNFCNLSCRATYAQRVRKGEAESMVVADEKRTCEQCKRDFQAYYKAQRFCGVSCATTFNHEWMRQHPTP